MKRGRDEGPIHIGKSLELREDFYSVAWLHWLSINTLTGRQPPKKPSEQEKGK